MKKTYRAYSVPTESNRLILKINAPKYVYVPWVPSRSLIANALTSPSTEEISLECDVAAYRNQSKPTRWFQYAQKELPITVKVAQPSVVSNGDPLFALESDDKELLTDVAEWLVASTTTQATVMALTDIREAVRRIFTRAGKTDPLLLSANSCILASRNPEQEFAAAIVFNQAPHSIDGISSIDSPKLYGRSIHIDSSIVTKEFGAAQFSNTTNADIPLWFCHSEKEFEWVFKNTKCIPIIPQYRDVTYIANFINKKDKCGLKSVGKQYAFYAVNPFDAKQGFKNIVDAATGCPAECISVVDFACKPLSFDLSSSNDVDTTKLVNVNDLITLNHDSFTKLMSQLT